MNDHGLSILTAGVEHIYTVEELKRKLTRAAAEKRQLRVKLGMDPTAPDIHLGHCVQLRKMRQFQDLGHKAILIIGDFTAMIGDPTGRSKTRPVLTEREIYHNAQTYLEQAGTVLDTAQDKLEVRRNSEWLGKMNFADVVKLAAKMTTQQLLKREDFAKRLREETPISLHELLYPLVQGWDSVNIQSDVELGGTDQTYNNLVGRDLQIDAGQEPQVVFVLPLLRGTDGEKKMSKSIGNYIAVKDSPTDMFGKTMSIPDSLLTEWFELLTTVSRDEASALIREHPMRAKDRLAREIGARFHKREEMDAAANWWRERFDPKHRKIEAVEVRVPANEIADGKIAAWKLAWLAHEQEISKSDARRLVEGGAFEFDGEKIGDPNALVAAEAGRNFRAGRHRKGEKVKQPLVAVIVLE